MKQIFVIERFPVNFGRADAWIYGRTTQLKVETKFRQKSQKGYVLIHLLLLVLILPKRFFIILHSPRELMKTPCFYLR